MVGRRSSKEKSLQYYLQLLPFASKGREVSRVSDRHKELPRGSFLFQDILPFSHQPYRGLVERTPNKVATIDWYFLLIQPRL